MTERFVYIKARVVREQDHVLTVRLEDGFANAEASIHKDFCLMTAYDLKPIGTIVDAEVE